MLLDALIAGLDVRPLAPVAGVRVCDVTDDSRTTVPGTLFIARRGAKYDGRAYADAAVRAGACAVLFDERDGPPPALRPGVVPLVTHDAALAMARLAERFYGDPSSKLRVAAVTGTNGKTTTCWLLHHVLGACGVRAGLISTVAIDDGVSRAPASMTTPPAIEISRTLGVMVESGCAAAVVETSSHALHQRRVAGLRIRVGVFTNLTGDHQDYHPSMDAYAAAKAMLFEMLPPDGAAVVNAEDPASARMVRDCRAPIFSCTFDGGRAYSKGEPCTVHIAESGARGSRLSLRGPWGETNAHLPLVGRHNAMNALQAVCAAHALGADAASFPQALTTATAPPGRLEPVARAPAGTGRAVAEQFGVYVDYAHTDDALARAIAAARPLVANGGRLIVVFGCGGERDRTKRPRMGETAAQLADLAIVTSDNPRTEDPAAIVRDVLRGVPYERREHVAVEVERDRAIRRAVHEAHPGDVVLIAGKGHEDYQLLPDGKGGIVRRDFDDRHAARAALIERFGQAS